MSITTKCAIRHRCDVNTIIGVTIVVTVMSKNVSSHNYYELHDDEEYPTR